MPASRAASGSMPMASIIRPSALRRTSRPTRITTSRASRNTTGSPRRYPLAIQRKCPLTAEVFWPLVITLARPRPAIIITSVEMKGCSPTTDTMKPLNRPSTTLIPSASRTARSADPSVSGAVARNCIDTAPATAITEPTDRSMPLVAMTRHMPIAIIMTGAAARRMSTRLPTSAPLAGLKLSAR